MMKNANNILVMLISLASLASLWLSGTHFVGIHIPPLIIALSIYVVITMLLMKPRISLSRITKLLFQISLVLITWMFILNTLVGTSIGETLRTAGGKVLIGALLAFCIWFSATSLGRLKYLLYTLIAGVTISALVGIGQYLVGGPFISIWAKTGGNLNRIWGIQGKAVIAGLAGYSVPLGYQLSAAIPLIFGLFRSAAVRHRKLLFGIFLLLIVALFLSAQRSAIIGATLGVLVVVWISSRRHKISYSVGTAMVGIMAYLMGGAYLNTKFIALVTASTLSRIPLWATAWLVALHHPFGTGTAGYMRAAHEVYGAISGLPASQYALELTSHNQFFNILGYYGFPGFFLLIAFYAVLFKILVRLSREVPQASYIYGIGAGLLGAFVAYVINSFFHNAGPFTSDLVHWYYIGIAIAAYRMKLVAGKGSNVQ